MFSFTADLPTSRNARITGALPLRLARLFSAITWGAYYALNIKGLRSTILPTVNIVLNRGTIRDYLTGMGGAIAFGRYIGDFSFFLHSPAAVIKRRVARSTGFRNAANLNRALAGGKGAILVSSNFSCFYYALTTARSGVLPDSAEVVIVQPFYSVGSEDAKRFKDKLSEVIGRELRIIESGTARAGIEMTAALKRGSIVACLVDFFPPNVTSLAITEFLNQPSCQPTGISAIAAKNQVAVVPCFTFYEKNKYVTEFADPIFPLADSGNKEQVLGLCTLIDLSLSTVILRRPSEWASWISVPHKWNTAASLLEQIEE